MMKKFAAFDIDGTIFRSGFYREVIFELIATGKAPAGLSQAFSQSEVNWKKRRSANAFSEFEIILATAFSKALPQIKSSDFDAAATVVFEKLSEHVYVYTRNLVAQLKKEGYVLIAISGSQEELVRPFADKYGFDHWIGQHYERGENGFFTGKTILTHDGKDKLLRRIVAEHGLSFKKSIAVGDTYGDVGMLSLVETPIAFNPDHELFERAKRDGWRIVIERKNMTYTLESHGNTYVLA